MCARAVSWDPLVKQNVLALLLLQARKAKLLVAMAMVIVSLMLRPILPLASAMWLMAGLERVV